VRVDGVLAGSIIIRSSPARRVSPIKYRVIFFLSSLLLFAVPEKRTKRKKALPFFQGNGLDWNKY
jgi:hypothetical protein